MDKRTNSDILNYVDQSAICAKLKNDTQLLLFVQLHWRTLYCIRLLYTIITVMYLA